MANQADFAGENVFDEPDIATHEPKYHLICSPNITVLVLLMFTLNDFNLRLDSFLMKDRADEVGDKPKNLVLRRHKLLETPTCPKHPKSAPWARRSESSCKWMR